MSERLTFTSVVVESFTKTPNGVTANCSASLTKDVIENMAWTEIPECMTGAELEGEIVCISLSVTPNDSALSKHAYDLDMAQLFKFKTVRLEIKNKRGVGHRTELRFKVKTQDPQAARKMELYMTLGDAKSKMKISYEKPAKQTELPGVEEADGKQAELPN